MRADKQAWRKAGDEFVDVGRQVKSHFAGASNIATDDRVAFETAIARFADLVEEGVAAIGASVHDERVRAGVTRAGESLRTALAATFEQMGKAAARATAGDGKRPAAKHTAPAAAKRSTPKPAKTAKATKPTTGA